MSPHIRFTARGVDVSLHSGEEGRATTVTLEPSGAGLCARCESETCIHIREAQSVVARTQRATAA